jgi:excisionase family DNA binding protein
MSTKSKPTANGVATAPPSPFDVLTPAQAAAYLQVGEDVVLREAEGGRLPGRKLGAEWRFLRHAIAEWLRSAPAGEAPPKSSKDRIREVIGVWKDDPTVDAMIDEIYRQRKADPVGGR